ncbi:hypothetical protein [Xylocopilactobacillus apis]|uniref:AbrB family transcriptional regulator n=1 Tax=Xylocopilactobacillus apis TaxID=2932183 RepID=A0AAU9CXK0_9LACO|nr:hypothetical protein [Xylocopilactobacillus apis]BDR57141.1 hypothetical protein KIMC2_17030 [Xylocopilactobacillus apis]
MEKNERILGEFSTRQTGNSVVLTVPKKAQIPAGRKYILFLKKDGTLEYRTAENNPWLNGEFADIDFKKEMADVGNYGVEKPRGKEIID